MKKIVGILSAAAVLAASVFAVDFSARNYMAGSIAGGDKDSAYIWKINKADQKDADALVLSANLDNAGAQMQFWYNYDGNGAAPLNVRNTSIWFKPIDQIKVTVGDLSTKLFGETLHYWKDPAGTAWNQYYNGYSGYGTVEQAGINVEITPIDGLYITAGIAAGTGTNFISFVKDVDPTIKAYGAGVKYNLNGVAGIPLTVGVEFRSAGSNAENVLGIGASYGGRYAQGFYGMVEARLRMNEGDSGKLDGITINNHFRFATGPFEAQLRAPVTIRTKGDDTDPSWLAYSAKVSYALDGITPYLLLGNDINNAGAYKLNKDFADSFGIEIKPGVSLNVGAASIDLAVLIDINGKLFGDNVAWSVPFELSLAF